MISIIKEINCEDCEYYREYIKQKKHLGKGTPREIEKRSYCKKGKKRHSSGGKWHPVHPDCFVPKRE